MSFRTSFSRAFTPAMSAAWRKMVGIALVWTGLAALVWVPQSGGSPLVAWVAVAGFISFASGITLLVDGFKCGLVAGLAGVSSSRGQK